MRTRDGAIYGPVNRQELDRWVAEGRVDDSCEFRTFPSGTWHTATKLYPHLAPGRSAAAPVPGQDPFADVLSPAARAEAKRGTYLAPHRGGFIVVLGVLSWVCQCPVFGIVAILAGAADMRAISAGQMDPAGRGLAQTGLILGLMHVVVWSCVLLPLFFWLLAWIF
jgi:hypothetical protein